MNRKIALVSGVAAALLFGVTSSASAGTLDQQQTSSDANAGLLSSPSNQTPAQTFTAGISGGIDQVDLLLDKVGTPPPTTVEIRNVSAGKPGSTVLATASLPASAVVTAPAQAFVPVTFTTPAPVTAGTQYAILAYGPGTQNTNAVGWLYQDVGNPYLSGEMFISTESLPPVDSFNGFPTNDLAFKTYVVPPPPTNTAPPATKKCKKKHKHHAASAKKHCKKKKH
jgi:hypothetical protein